MSENKGFFSEIKNQVVTGVGLVITAAFGWLKMPEPLQVNHKQNHL